MLTRNHRQEAFCRAYVQAVAAVAGVGTSVPVPDYGVDLSLRRIEKRGSRRVDARLQLDLQLRSTARANVSDNEIRFNLDVAMYELLREPSLVRCILVVLVLPEDEASWMNQSADAMIVRHCAYWHSLRGAAPTTATSSVRVVLSPSRVFSPEAIRDLFLRLSQGGEP